MGLNEPSPEKQIPAQVVFLDRLSVSSLLHLLPQGAARWLLRREEISVQYFSASRVGKLLSAVPERLGWLSAAEVDYSYIDVRDREGALVGFRVGLMDASAICGDARSDVFEAHPLVARFAARFDRDRVLMYLEKSLSEELTPTLMRINVVSWLQGRHGQDAGSHGAFYIAKTPWHRLLAKYARGKGVVLRPYVGLYRPEKPIVGTMVLGLVAKLAWALAKRVIPAKRPAHAVKNVAPALGRTVAVRFTGFGLTLDQSKNSDLFWVPHAELRPNQLLVYFARSDDRLDNSKLTYLKELGIGGVALTGGAKGEESVPTWPDARNVRSLVGAIWAAWRYLVLVLVTGVAAWGIGRWIAFKLFEFGFDYVYWRWMFARFNVRLHVDPADHVRYRAASDQAIADLGGVSVGYQRSSDLFASVMRSTSVDVHFAFAPLWAEIARDSRSSIGQFISNGYVHDRVFSLVKTKSCEIRDRLYSRGARFIICFFDENSLEDKRRGPTHSFAAEDFRYLLERLVKDPALGLVFKPKKPTTFRRRLGKVADLLDQAVETGRCYVYEEGIAATEVLPAEASQAADVNIGLMWGGTAAMEAALAGGRSVLLDRGFMSYHPLYALGVGQVVFLDWDSLWDALTAFRQEPKSAPGFGDWSAMLDKFDPFRDGKAAKRMGEYIGWLSEALGRGLEREQALALARGKYVAVWGEDKVIDLRQAQANQGLELRTPQLIK
jgi:hypothetical protein